MKSSLFLLFTIFLTSALNGQTDSIQFEPEPIPLVGKEYSVYVYDSTLQMNILTYQYADLWDVDDDGIKDSVAFIGNGGAHTFYHFEIRLSSQKNWMKFPQFLIDLPYILETENPEFSEHFPQFAVDDFDQDGVEEIYLNVKDASGGVSEELEQMGLNSGRILIEFEKGDLIYRSFTEK